MFLLLFLPLALILVLVCVLILVLVLVLVLATLLMENAFRASSAKLKSEKISQTSFASATRKLV